MGYTILLVILVVGSLVVLAWLVWRKWPHLRIVDPETSKEEKSRQLKYELLRQRVERAGGKRVDALKKGFLSPVGKGFQNAVRRVAGKLTAVERSYQARQKAQTPGTLDEASVKQLITEGKKLAEDELWDRAEKTFIEVIRHEPKNVEAYERLGRLYIARRDYELAMQTFQFLSKLSPNDPSVIASLGEVEDKLGHKEKAYRRFKRAKKLAPNNPKYLDFFIESAIEMGEKGDALDGLKQLKTVNPENKKIETFSRQIADLSIVTERTKGKKTK